VTPRDLEAIQARNEARIRVMAKWHDGTQQITTEDVPHFTGDELRQLADAGRLVHLGIGPDKRLRR
jgi:hypothetical protein